MRPMARPTGRTTMLHLKLNWLSWLSSRAAFLPLRRSPQSENPRPVCLKATRLPQLGHLRVKGALAFMELV